MTSRTIYTTHQIIHAMITCDRTANIIELRQQLEDEVIALERCNDGIYISKLRLDQLHWWKILNGILVRPPMNYLYDIHYVFLLIESAASPESIELGVLDTLYKRPSKDVVEFTVEISNEVRCLPSWEWRGYEHKVQDTQEAFLQAYS